MQGGMIKKGDSRWGREVRGGCLPFPFELPPPAFATAFRFVETFLFKLSSTFYFCK